ncbi:MAG: hypothetical protein ACXWFN_06825 [Solirubrobacterales bacterium]
MADLDSKYRPALEGILDPGEELRGLCVASQQKGLFKGGAVVLGVTERRLVVQPLSRRGEPGGEPKSLTPQDISSAKAGGAGGGWWNVSAGIMDHAAVQLEIRKAAGGKLKLMMMRGEGGMLGKLGGGEPQRRGIEALAEWFRAIEP